MAINRVLMLLVVVATLIHTVTSVNNAPIWVNTLDTELKTHGIDENTPVGTKIGTLEAYDPEGLPITYSFAGEALLVNATTGDVFLNMALDREIAMRDRQAAFLQVMFSASDGENTHDVDTVITVNDVNDNVPAFKLTTGYTATVSENALVNTPLLTGIIIEDEDQGYNAEVSLDCHSKPDDLGSIEACEKFNVSLEMVDSVDPFITRYSGTVYLKGQVDYEISHGYTLTLIAEDNGSPRKLNSTVNVLIVVQDEQDTLPEFLNTPIVINTNETDVFNKVVGVVQAQDGDTGSSRPIKLVMDDTNNDVDKRDIFRLGPAVRVGTTQVFESAIIINGSLDREFLQGRYTFSVTAIELLPDGSEAAARTSTLVSVNILDINDNPPLFDSDTYSINVLESVGEGQIPGLSMFVTDDDDTSNGRFLLRVRSQSIAGVFDVSPREGTSAAIFSLVLLDSSFIDYENPLYMTQTLVVEAVEMTSPALFTSSATVTINIQDINDNVPQFHADVQNYTYEIYENEVQVTPILTIMASDQDSGDAGTVRYSLESNQQGFLRIDSVSGEVFIVKALNYESIETVNVMVVASDQGIPQQRNQILLTIIVVNVNDIAPQFVASRYQTSVTENDTTLIPSVTVFATDAEPGTSIVYSIISGNTVNSTFYVEPVSGSLHMRHPIYSVEQTPNKRGWFELEVEANDQGSPPMTNTTIIVVTVIDVNTNPPIFTEVIYRTRINETAPPNSLVLIISAMDSDLNDNALIRYELGSGGSDQFALQTVGTRARLYVASTASLDYETQNLYELLVYAVDQGSPPKTGTATISIEILNANNKDPVFNQSLYTFAVSESESVGSSVGSVQAWFSDGPGIRYTIDQTSFQPQTPLRGITNPSLFNYQIAFRVDEQNGLITVGTVLNYDRMSQIGFNVFAYDTEIPAQRATASVFITINQKQEYVPYFVGEWTPETPNIQFDVSEQQLVGTVLTDLLARDPANSDQEVKRYSKIQGSDGGRYFTLVESSGIVTWRRVPDYENTVVHTLSLSVVAHGINNSAIAHINVFIVNINDHEPIFADVSYSFTVPENANTPYIIGTVEANDADSDRFGDLTFSLQQGGSSEIFGIYKLSSSLAQVYVKQDDMLDREAVPDYTIYVIASDSPGEILHYSTTVPIYIKVIDVNDNPPEFDQTDYTFSLYRDSPLERFTKVHAFDRDEGINRDLTYELIEIDGDPGNPYLEIDLKNGDISLRRELDDLEGGIYRYEVTARDDGVPSLSSTVPIILEYLRFDTNDSSPRFTFPGTGDNTAELRENSVGITNITVQATSPINVQIEYGFIETSNIDYQSFDIDSRSGDITVKAGAILDRESKPEYELLVYAQYEGGLSLRSALLIIRLLDENDNDALLGVGTCSRTFTDNIPVEITHAENTLCNDVLITVDACDQDVYPNNIIDYQMNKDVRADCEDPDGSPFEVVRSTGVVRLRRCLDYEAKHSHLLCIKATSVNPVSTSGRRKRDAENVEYPDNTTVAYIKVYVTDVNDNSPVFNPNTKVAWVMELASQGETVTTVSANDDDTGDRARTIYSIVRINFTRADATTETRGVFSIEPSTGEIVTRIPRFSPFRNGYFEVIVQAQDLQEAERTDIMIVKIVVVDTSRYFRVINEINEGDGDPDIDKRNRIRNDLISMINVRGWTVEVTELRYSQNLDGTTDYKKVDTCFIVLSEDQQSVVDYNLVSQNINNRADNSGSDIQVCNPAIVGQQERWITWWWVLIAFAIFIFFMCVILILIFLALSSNYKRYISSQRTFMEPVQL